MSLVIKRYPNRKLYNTSTKRYITLDGIASLIKQGDEVQIIDHSSGEDLTTLTLTQIIFEQEKKKGGFLPKSVLTGLIQTSGETLNTLKNTIPMPPKPADLWRNVDEEIERRMNDLISRGELARDEGLRLSEELLAYSTRGLARGKAAIKDAEIEAKLAERGIPTNDELKKLFQRLDDLTSKLDSFTENADEEMVEAASEAVAAAKESAENIAQQATDAAETISES